MTVFVQDKAGKRHVGSKRLGFGLALVSVATAWANSELLAVLLPAKVTLLSSEAGRAGVLALVATIANIAGLFSSFLSGSLSDRTRSRWGKRAPWMVATGLGAAISVAVLTVSASVPMLVLGTSMAVVFLFAQLVITSAIIPDRVPLAERGTLSACIGVGQLIGLALGLMVGGRFVAAPDTGLLLIAAIPFAAALLFVFLVPEPSNRDEPALASSGSSILRSLLPPARAGDFYWAVGQRFFIVFGTQMILAYQLYIITDHLKQGPAGAAAALSQAAIAYTVGALIGSVLGGPVSDRSGRRKAPVMASAFVIGASALLLVAFPTVWSLTIYKVLNGFGYGIYLAVHAALTSQVLPDPETRGKDMGFLNVANGLGGAIAPSVSAAALGLGFGYDPLLIIACTLCVGSLFLIIPIRSVR